MNARRALGIMFLSSNAMTLVQFGVTLVLARLLSPSDVGIFSMTVMFANIAALFRDFGVTTYLQREPELDDDKRASALTFLLLTSWGTAALMYLVSEPVARFFDEPGVGRVMRVFCLSFLIVPFASYFYGLLARELQAGRQAVVSAVGTVAYGGSCLGLAALDFGYMSLAWANLANIAATIAAHLVMRSGKLPRRVDLRHWRSLLHFGGGSLVGALLDRVNQSVPDLMLGKLSGAHGVGLFSRANGLIGLMGQVMGPTLAYTTLPYLANNHNAGTAVGPIIVRGLAMVCAVGWPVYFGLALFSEEVIGLLYGEQWVAAAPLATILAIGAAAKILVCLTAASMSAIGRPYLSAQSSAVDLTARVVAVGVSGVGELWHFALAIAIADVVTTPFLIWQMRRYLGLHVRELARALLNTLRACLPAFIVVLLLRLGLPGNGPDWMSLFAVFALGTPAWFIGIRWAKHPLLDEVRQLFAKILPPAAQRWSVALLGRRG